MSDIIWNICGFIVAISILVCIHEYGHYWMARRLGVKVLRFALGWGKPFWTHRAKDGVEWSLAPYPIGGYVKLLDEREGPVAEHERHLAFNNQSVLKRMAILFAGPLFNFLLAIAVYWGVFVHGTDNELKPMIGAPVAGSAAAKAGLQSGEEILSVGGVAIPTWTVLQTELLDATLDRGQLALSVRNPAGETRQVSLDLDGVRVDPDFLFDDLGLKPNRPPTPAVIAGLVPGKAAQAAGFEVGDRLITRDGEPVNSWEDWSRWVRAHAGAVVKIGFERGGEPRELTLVIGQDRRDGKTIGLFGAEARPLPLPESMRTHYSRGPLEAVPAAIGQTWQMSAIILKTLAKMVTGEVSVKNVSGPIQIAQAAGYSAQVGLIYFLNFLAVVSVSLGVLNLLPVPLLDGGHLLMYAIEGIKGRPLSERVQAASQYVGFAFIGMLMMLAFYNDIMRLI